MMPIFDTWYKMYMFIYRTFILKYLIKILQSEISRIHVYLESMSNILTKEEIQMVLHDCD